MKTCPKCGSHKIITYSLDDDKCQKCNERFPALVEEKCVTGCKAYTGNEIKHHKHCPYYPESFSKMYDDLKEENRQIKYNLAIIHEHTNLSDSNLKKTFTDASRRIRKRSEKYSNLEITAGPLYDGEDDDDDE